MQQEGYVLIVYGDEVPPKRSPKQDVLPMYCKDPFKLYMYGGPLYILQKFREQWSPTS